MSTSEYYSECGCAKAEGHKRTCFMNDGEPRAETPTFEPSGYGERPQPSRGAFASDIDDEQARTETPAPREPQNDACHGYSRCRKRDW